MAATTTISDLLNAFAEELNRLEIRLMDLLKEGIPGLSEELLTDWERVLGLPDECSSLGSTLEQRQATAHTKYVGDGFGIFGDEKCPLSEQYYIDYAASIGSTITIIEQPNGGEPFRVNENRVDRTPELGIDGARLNSIGSRNRWAIVIPADDPNGPLLECIFQKLKPAHTSLLVIFGLIPDSIQSEEAFGSPTVTI